MSERPDRRWFWIRVSVLLVILASVSIYAWRDSARRRARTEWRRTLDVALVTVEQGTIGDEAVAALRARVGALETKLAEELERHRPGAPKPFSFVWFGPAEQERPPPSAPDGSLLDAARYAWELHRFTSDVDERAGVPSRGFDSRVYLLVRPPSEAGWVEGISEHGGWVGVALADLDETTVDLALIVAAHELLHTLGATDRYGPDGRTLIPEGLAEPERSPPFPQEYVELMARNRPIDENTEVPPRSLDEVRVGDKTASEIGWR